MENRICISCGKPIPLHKRADAIKCDGNCDGASRQEKSRRKDPTRHKEVWRKWAFSLDGTMTLLLNYARDRARRLQLPFDLDREFLRQKLEAGVCELSGLPIERVAPGNHRTHPFAPSLDRKEPTMGYEKSNVRLVCFAVNRARSDWGDEVLLTIANGIVKHITA